MITLKVASHSFLKQVNLKSVKSYLIMAAVSSSLSLFDWGHDCFFSQRNSNGT